MPMNNAPATLAELIRRMNYVELMRVSQDIVDQFDNTGEPKMTGDALASTLAYWAEDIVDQQLEKPE